MRSMNNASRLAAIGFVLGMLIASPVIAHKGATGVVKQRMDEMKSLKTAMKQLQTIVKGERPFASSVVIKHAETISTLTDRMGDRFPKGSNPHPSESLSAIWTNWPDFMRKVSDLKTAADRLSGAQSRSEFAAAFRDVGGTCSSCHKAYRQEK